MTVGFVNKLETFATLDGDGIRVAVFMQGCPLKCNFCHNPDTQKIFSRDCAERADRPVSFPSAGTKLYKATAYTPETLVAKILRYKPYLTDGGVTFSGGEPLLQAVFLSETCELLKKHNINIAIDTSCSIYNPDVELLLSHCDTVIADLKFPNEEEYKKYTGGSLKTVIEFLKRAKQNKKRILLRTVIIPDINDTPEYVENYLNLLKNNDLLSAINDYELLPFHTMGFSKYDDFGIENKLKNVSSLDINKLKYLQSLLQKQL